MKSRDGGARPSLCSVAIVAIAAVACTTPSTEPQTRFASQGTGVANTETLEPLIVGERHIGARGPVADAYLVSDLTPLDEVLDHMAAQHIGSALVTKHGRLAGIFTSTDACRVYCDHLRRMFPKSAGTDVA